MMAIMMMIVILFLHMASQKQMPGVSKIHILNILKISKPATSLTQIDPKAFNIFTIFWHKENPLSPFL
jgi:hypothetical protein